MCLDKASEIAKAYAASGGPRFVEDVLEEVYRRLLKLSKE